MDIKIDKANLVLEKKKILDDISIEMESGKIYGLIGRNGSGKTMIMKCICGFMHLTSGQVLVDNKVIGQDIDFPENLGIIIENPGFIPYYSGYKNLKLLADVRKKIGKDDIIKAMEVVGLDPYSKLHVGKYSLGMRQRLGIAQAIMEDPELLILDEPMNGLDSDGVEDIRKVLLDLKKQGKTVIIASHNYMDIDILCDKVWKIEKGKIIS